MTNITAKGGVGKASLEIVVTRADGTVENYGTVCEYRKNPLKRWALNLYHKHRVQRLIKEYERSRNG